ncbi:NADP-dependent oxidoreductase domain-containing protein [Fusarium redolens]|uniref:NADP-dependent oxidoreductase domain-containing protein n=1 Tax=Fusarium redolens TaxID=48865 RepID=A0A9P9JUT5_FUSRE|nr:NADP-dependent oxidoreductase domain-containing protein [Fusarium redolens]KAH7237808.1 NADP-dependent oxidoreductase domain-containing protein [Fusarium redolens]
MVKNLPFADITVPSPGFGAMGISHGLGNNLTLEEAEFVLLKAIKLELTEYLVANLMLSDEASQEMFVDAGFVYNLKDLCQNNGFTPDLYYLHRIDPMTPLGESIAAKIESLQAEYSAFKTLHETDGLIDAARELGVAYVAYSPLGHGWLVDDFPYQSRDDVLTAQKLQGKNFYHSKKIVEEIKKLVARKSVKVTQIALAWVAAQGFIAIPGTTKPERLEENWASRDVELDEEEKAELRRIIDSAKPKGNRYGPAHQAMMGH